MRDQLIRYVDLLFAGAADADDIKQEILQNTLDRYDDLLAQGKAPQAAYSLAIAGIGDVSELLQSIPGAAAESLAHTPATPVTVLQQTTPAWKKTLRIIAIFLYIISIIPLIVLSNLGMDVLGLCGTIGIVAVATVLILFSASGRKPEKEPEVKEASTPQQELRKATKNAISTVGLVVYFVVSFATGAWHITWLIFPIMGAIQGIVNACLDLKEAKEHET